MKSALHQTTAQVHPLPAIGTIHLIPVSMLHPMPCSPFKIRDDDAMQELVLSIKNFGILNPLEVRPNDSGNYEIISGARRYQGAIQNQLKSIPAVILDLDDDEAIIRMVDSNIQREYLLPSERAYAYKMRMEALKRKAGRPKKAESKNSPKISANFRSDDSIGEKAGISGDTVRNYISLTLLVPALMQLVDESKIGLTPAYQLTHLSPAEQNLLFETIESEQATPSLSQVQRMRRLSEQGQLNEDSMLSIMMEQKKPVKRDVALSGDKLRKYFPKHYSPEQIETIIFKLLDVWISQKSQNIHK
ncbi:MAG: ParB/RepB/Spo0J family partition protein [Oscillospiraceae bacterium]|nr:ParB/RepB/Spo0J family partition protein [Oscillospiraceae bacterium]